MSKKIHLIIILIFIINLLVTGLALAQSDTAKSVKEGLTNTGVEAGFSIIGEQGKPDRSFAEAVGRYVSGLATILGALFMLLIIYGGWLWMSARGNDDQVSKAKAIIIGAVIGIAIVITAQIIVQLALKALSTTVPFG